MDDYFNNYRILIDGRWSLEDLYRFPRAYEQVYFAIESLLPAEDEETQARLERAFQAYPWQGGYSAVNFYNSLKYMTPKDLRPSITSIQYASPGWIELFLNLPLAVQVAGAITSLAGSLAACNRVYHQIWNNLHQRKLLGIEYEKKKIELSKDEISLVKHSFDELSAIIGIDNVNAIHSRTNDPLISLKILLSIYRRLRDLAEFQKMGKARFEPPKIKRSTDDLL